MQPNHLEGQHSSSPMVFNHNHHFAFIYKKTEKLVTALYMITNFIKDNEPLKWRIRENALELLSLNMSFNTVSLSERKDLLKQYQAYSVEIVSLASIACHSGLISQMNFGILKTEFDALVAVIEKDENKKANEETVILNPSFFDAPHGRRDTEASGIISRPESRPEAVPVKDIIKDTPSFAPKVSAKPEVKDDRRAAIMKLLSKKSGLAIKDFTDTIKGVSEKTIQRELLALVASGAIKKAGERRWSTYSLA